MLRLRAVGVDEHAGRVGEARVDVAGAVGIVRSDEVDAGLRVTRGRVRVAGDVPAAEREADRACACPGAGAPFTPCSERSLPMALAGVDLDLAQIRMGGLRGRRAAAAASVDVGLRSRPSNRAPSPGAQHIEANAAFSTAVDSSVLTGFGAASPQSPGDCTPRELTSCAGDGISAAMSCARRTHRHRRHGVGACRAPARIPARAQPQNRPREILRVVPDHPIATLLLGAARRALGDIDWRAARCSSR